MATRRVPPFSRCSRSRLLQGLRYCNICNTTALPMREPPAEGEVTDAAELARQLSSLGYPGFAHLRPRKANPAAVVLDRKSTRLNSSHDQISYAVFCLKKKKKKQKRSNSDARSHSRHGSSTPLYP